MKVIAFDPGYDRLGVAILALEAGVEHLYYSTCITTDSTQPLHSRLHSLGTQVSTIIDEHAPDTVALETLFFNKNQKTAIGVAQARGIILYLTQAAGCQVFEFGPQAVKVAVTGYGASDKKSVIDMVRRLVTNAPENAHDDEYDAIAVGITCLAHHGRGR
jgi:crossover junction endodeoxyribonuclease RuvC